MTAVDPATLLCVCASDCVPLKGDFCEAKKKSPVDVKSEQVYEMKRFSIFPHFHLSKD